MPADTSKPTKRVGCCGDGEHRSTSLPGLGWLSGERVELAFAITAAVTLLIGWGLSFASGWALQLSVPVLVVSYFFGGYFALVEALHGLRHGQFQIDFLMIVAAVGAGVLGAWAEGALLLTLFSIGHALEHYAMGRARKSIASLGKLRPQTALRLEREREREVPIEELAVGDTVVVQPDSTIPIDGVVISGESEVDQSAITGESIPVSKTAHAHFDAEAHHDLVDDSHRVFAGTLNGGGLLHVWVTREAADTTLARLMQLVVEAQSKRSPTQRLTDAFERYYVPSVLILVVALLALPPLLLDESFGVSFYRAMAVLVAASPCALAIATPSAVLSGVARAGNRGLLFKGGGPLERLGQVTTIAFDKTGTLTTGKPQLTDVCPVGGVSQEELLEAAAAVERLSPHPLARSVWKVARERLGAERVAKATELQSIAGKGVQAELGGETISIGTESLLNGDGESVPAEISRLADELRQGGRTIMIVRAGDRFLGVLGLQDTPRPSAAPALRALRGMGIKKMVMLSGDHQSVANHVARIVGLDQALGDLLPEDKVAAVERLNADQLTAMIGDGVNDAPAMATAGVSVAMGAAGSDVALETADVALMGDDLARLPFALQLSRQTSRIIRQNVWISLGMIAVLVPSAIFGLNLAVAVVFHEGSTVMVVLNALRLLGFRDRSGEVTAAEETAPLPASAVG
jgi:Cd2+/Zn2+-exporting ATPase